MKSLIKYIPFILAFAASSVSASEQAPVEHRLAPAKVVHIIEAPLDLAYPTTADMNVLNLRIKDAEKLLASKEGHLWAPFGTIAGDCGAPPKLTGKTNADKAAHATLTKAYEANCKKAKAACDTATKFSERHSVSATCSALYGEARALLTTIESQPGYVNPYDDAALDENADSVDGTGKFKAPIK